jgi:hypothetical protein
VVGLFLACVRACGERRDCGRDERAGRGRFFEAGGYWSRRGAMPLGFGRSLVPASTMAVHGLLHPKSDFGSWLMKAGVGGMEIRPQLLPSAHIHEFLTLPEFASRKVPCSR